MWLYPGYSGTIPENSGLEQKVIEVMELHCSVPAFGTDWSVFDSFGYCNLQLCISVYSCSWWRIILPPELSDCWLQRNGWNSPPQIITFAILALSLGGGCFTDVFLLFCSSLLPQVYGYGHWIAVPSNCLKRWKDWGGGCHVDCFSV